MKNTTLTFFLLIIVTNCMSQTFQWGINMPHGHGVPFYTHGKILVDDNKNIYKAGTFTNTINPNPGVISNDITSNGGNDIFITKVDSNGIFQWVKHIGGIGHDYFYQMHYDGRGGILLTGSFEDSVDFDPSPIGNDTLYAGLGNKIYLLKLDTSGNYQWTKSYGGGQDYCRSITTDIDGNIYSTGDFNMAVDFDPGLGTYNIGASGFRDCFVSKLDSSGNFVWARRARSFGSGSIYGTSITVDSSSNVYVTGDADQADFDPSFNDYILSGAGSFIWKLDSSGNFVWARRAGNPTTSGFGKEIIYRNNNVHLIGGLLTTTDFDEGPGTFNLSPTFTHEYFLLQVNATNGNFINATLIPGVYTNAHPFGFEIDSANNFYISYSIQTSTDFDLDSNIYRIGSPTYFRQAYYLKLDANMDFAWAKVIQPLMSSQSSGSDLTIDHDGGIYIAGNYAGVVDVNPGAGNYYLNSLGTNYQTEGFIAKLNDCCQPYTFIRIDTCASNIVIDSFNFTSSQYRIFYYNDINFCDSNIAYEVNLYSNSYDSISITTCDSFYFNGQYLNSPGTYYDTLVNQSGCDSTIKLNLNITQIDTTITISSILFSNESASNASYQWLDCRTGHSVIPGANNQNFSPTWSGEFAVQLTKGNCIDTSQCVVFQPLNNQIINKDSSILIYPIPAKNMLSIYSSEEIKNGNLNIYNALGQLVKWKENINGKIHNLDISNISSGIYFMELRDENNSHIQKILKTE